MIASADSQRLQANCDAGVADSTRHDTRESSDAIRVQIQSTNSSHFNGSVREDNILTDQLAWKACAIVDLSEGYRVSATSQNKRYNSREQKNRIISKWAYGQIISSNYELNEAREYDDQQDLTIHGFQLGNWFRIEVFITL